jgi:hypothetical protein
MARVPGARHALAVAPARAAPPQTSLRRLERAERLQRALYAIADLASSELEMPDMLREVHQIVGELMYAENFYIVLRDAARGTLRFIYFADTQDQEVPDPRTSSSSARSRIR